MARAFQTPLLHPPLHWYQQQLILHLNAPLSTNHIASFTPIVKSPVSFAKPQAGLWFVLDDRPIAKVLFLHISLNKMYLDNI